MFERFTDRARRVLVLAQEEARLLNHGFIGTEHLLLGLIHEDDGVAAKALAVLGISLERTRATVEDMLGPSTGPEVVGSPPFTPRAKKVLEYSLREALQLGHNYIGTEHILLGVLREGEGVGARALVAEGADLEHVRAIVLSLVSSPATAGTRLEGSTLDPRPRRGSLAGCSFCERKAPETGRLIAGRPGAFICEHCVGQWSARLAEGGPDTAPGPHVAGAAADDRAPDDPTPDDPTAGDA